jgi:hypothetical protein
MVQAVGGHMLLIGREYRKAVSQTFAYAAFRAVAIWGLVAACASQGQAGKAAALVIVAVDIMTIGVGRGTTFLVKEKEKTDWLDRLTNRFFYKLLIERIQSGEFRHIDPDELFNAARKEALEDIKIADEPSFIGLGMLDTTGWHWFGGVLSFVYHCIYFLLYYGSAVMVGGH